MAKLSLDAIPFEKISALTLAQRIVIFAGTLLLLGGGYFYFVHIPRSSKISQLKKEHEELKVKLAKAKSAAKSFDVVNKKYKEAQVNLKLALQLLPDKREIPGLLESISRSGRHSGLEFLLFKPSKEVLRDFYAEIPVSIEVTGGYHNLAMFFDKVSRLSRIVNMSDIKIRHGKGGKEAEGRLNATCVATTYRFVEPSKAAAAKKKKKKKK
jgi:type IV pilus assembly protein PilO